jgi:phenylpyruvate tautomerase PptA (4-oxalocrotonate tautomerase family)
MAQIKIFGLRAQLKPIKRQLSDCIHSCIVEALSFPPEKRFHRFFPLDAEDFLFPKDRSERYIIIEIAMFAGRAVEVKKKLIALLFERLQQQLNFALHDVEITITETPRSNWGIRGQPGDELTLNYKI